MQRKNSKLKRGSCSKIKLKNCSFETDGESDEIERGASAIGDEGVGDQLDPPAGVDAEIPLRRRDGDVSTGAADNVGGDHGLHGLRAVGDGDEDLRRNFQS